MSIYKMFDGIVQYLSEAVTRIFSPRDDAYPAIGVQPFDGDFSRHQQDKDW
ncbi:MAG: hypothetical protein JOZ78_12285 [Chroococcidiopsidaceae cyanobacterium CP_BM_ER_R8_30]|nr:hypothetical protein [Chroococcidiopsidaceae cyanobacterium CP_BM_ER_R8_30]